MITPNSNLNLINGLRGDLSTVAIAYAIALVALALALYRAERRIKELKGHNEIYHTAYTKLIDNINKRLPEKECKKKKR